MGILYVLDKSKGTSLSVWDGSVTGEEWYRNVSKLLMEPDLPSIRYIIVDVQTVSDTSSIGEAEIEAVITLLSAQMKIMINKRIAVIASNVFGKAKKIETSISRIGISIVVFNSLETACTFLGIHLAETRQTLEGLRSKLRGGEHQI